MSLNTLFDSNQEALFSRAASEVASFLASRQEREMLTLGLCGGRSVVGLLSALASNAEALREISGRLQIFLVDERLVPLDHADSNFRLLRAELLDPLCAAGLLKPEQLHPFDAGANPEQAVASYITQLERCGGSFDVVFLGVGEDGHVASLFPNHPLLGARKTFALLSDSPKPPPGRMTVTPEMIGNAGLAVVMFLGEGKRLAYERFVNPHVTLEQCPAKLALRAGSTVIVTNIEGAPPVDSSLVD